MKDHNWSSIGDGGDIKIQNVSIADCCAPPCIFHKGENATIVITFQSSKDFSTLTQDLCGEIVTCLPLPGQNTDTCQDVTCPIEANKQYMQKFSVPVSSSYPSVSLYYRCFGNGSKNSFCVGECR